ncbi:hypothetical protein HUU61_20990 [Rhodopseudomonas palustris]|uniref:Uncharacterized protein n=1 Tax=Thiospirillum jenense TaxID=1653858 RepID=A0A839HL85_9GAMM|nr:anaerobic ribonucleoside-triphosphate reductase [Thiospirillum jenense]MBB1093756.1 hypothetical protein [Rhodopseudomonas palustris]MBB1127237.1 hypothetical protein [Thiospirillum jenense]
MIYNDHYSNALGIELCDEERTHCEVWTRVMGYHRPVSAFNAGKQSEHKERLYFREHPVGIHSQRYARSAA